MSAIPVFDFGEVVRQPATQVSVPLAALGDETLSFAARGLWSCLWAGVGLGARMEEAAEALDELKARGYVEAQGTRLIVLDSPLGVKPDPVHATPVSTAEAGKCPIKKLVELYHEHCPSLPRVLKVSGTQKERFLQSRWKEQPDLAFWAHFFARVERSAFLRGANRRGWRADFEWIVRPNNFAKIIEGSYDDRNGTTPGEAGSPQDRARLAWQEVLALIRRCGAYRTPPIEDEALRCTIKAMGGWQQLCAWSERDLGFRMKHFQDLYLQASEGREDEADGMRP